MLTITKISNDVVCKFTVFILLKLLKIKNTLRILWHSAYKFRKLWFFPWAMLYLYSIYSDKYISLFCKSSTSLESL